MVSGFDLAISSRTNLQLGIPYSNVVLVESVTTLGTNRKGDG
jgi:hypothetical protein